MGWTLELDEKKKVTWAPTVIALCFLTVDAM